MLIGTCARLWRGREGSLCSQVKPVTVRMVYYVSNVQASLGVKRVRKGYCHVGALLESHILKMTRKSVKVEEKGSEL